MKSKSPGYFRALLFYIKSNIFQIERNRTKNPINTNSHALIFGDNLSKSIFDLKIFLVSNSKINPKEKTTFIMTNNIGIIGKRKNTNPFFRKIKMNEKCNKEYAIKKILRIFLPLSHQLNISWLVVRCSLVNILLKYVFMLSVPIVLVSWHFVLQDRLRIFYCK